MINSFDAIIEISADSDPIKYEFDKEIGMIRVDRIMPTSMYYPCNYGFIPKTKGGDGDPIDILIHSSYKLIPGSIIKVRAIGVLHTEDEGGIDAKIISVPDKKVDCFLANINKYEDLSQIFIDKIQHFFENYKKLEKNKWVKVIKWGNTQDALDIIKKSTCYENI
ncbi:inorganic diphosphatase [Lyticum sinuosum]|uniref:Inorganic pyrophosphatase n=1 Tax=Lyticum sinuosum TaxID=1332059 RepID=A0AAE5AHP5_9RICK|nr:inorganic diphosphatase [Lyticum sinuosum]MDZ5761358.1 Inorganic pyrophosphatase [Lyticum sinuosum]